MISHYTPQEISNLLANQLTLEEEDAVQAELLELQAASVSFVVLFSWPYRLRILVGSPNPTSVAIAAEGTTSCPGSRG